MSAYLALYEGPTSASAKLVHVTGDSLLIELCAERMLLAEAVRSATLTTREDRARSKSRRVALRTILNGEATP